MRRRSIPVYTYAELSDSAKEQVRSRLGQYIDYDCVCEDAATVADLLGIDIRKTRKTMMGGWHRYVPTIYWSGFWSQGDGACFEGTYKYKKGAVDAVKSYAPQDKELHRIAYALQEAQRPFFYKLCATMKHRGHYQHSGCMQVEVEVDSDNDYSDSATLRNSEGTVIQCMRDFADWIYKRLEEEYEYQTSDEAVAETCEANGYEFYEDGSIA